MKRWYPFLALAIATTAVSAELPPKYVELLDYVQPAPDQGETVTCLFVASTGAMELIANKKAGIKDPEPYGPYDLSESFLINAPFKGGGNFLEVPVNKFNGGFGIHIKDWSFEAWNAAEINRSVWHARAITQLPKVTLPKIKTVPLFMYRNRWATNVLDDSHILMIKDALVKYRSPVLVNYNDGDYWHVVNIVGYDDNLPGDCYEIPEEHCRTLGAFYVRDSYGVPVDLRDYDWLKIKGNAAVVVTEGE